MLNAYHWLQRSGTDARMIMQVHDELVFETSVDIIDDFIVQLRNCMTTAAELAVPLVVDIGTGSNWDQAH